MRHNRNTRDQDLIEDDIYFLVQAKEALITVLADTKKLVSAAAFDEYAIGIEQNFDEMTHKPFYDLLDEAGIWQEWPKSPWYAQWLDTMTNHLVTRIITNPATHKQLGEVL